LVPDPAAESLVVPDDPAPAEKDFAFIDLQPQANLKVDDKFWIPLPKGEQTRGGIPLQVGERFIQLGATYIQAPPNQQPRTMPDKVEHIKVGRAFEKLHILHATDHGGNRKDGDPGFVADDTPIGEYTVHYEDGDKEAIPVVYGQDVRDWWFGSEGVRRGKVAWEAETALAAKPTGVRITLRLYLTTWKNPKPARKVDHIDYSRRKDTAASPFCVAMTAEGGALGLQKGLHRWRVTWPPARDNSDALGQLQHLKPGMGASLAIGVGGTRYRVFRNLSQRPARGEVEDLTAIQNYYRLRLEDRKRVGRLATALGIKPPPPAFLILLPPELKAEMVRLEREKLGGASEEDINETHFEIVSDGGGHYGVRCLSIQFRPGAKRSEVTRGLGEETQLSGHLSAITALAASADGDRLVSGGVDGSVRLWDVNSARELHVLNGAGKMTIGCVALLPNGRIAAASGEWTCVWDTATGTTPYDFTFGPANSLSFSSDGRRLVTAGCMNRSGIDAWWVDKKGLGPSSWPTPWGITRCLACVPGDRFVLCVPGDGAVHVVDASPFKDMPTKPVEHVRGGLTANVLTTIKEVGKPIRSSRGAITAIAASPNDQEFTFAAVTGEFVEIWQLNPLRLLRSCPNGHRVTALAYAPDGRTLLAGCADRVVHLWDVKTGQELRRFQGDTQAVRAVALSRGGRAFTAGDDKVVRVWDLAKPAAEPPPVPPAEKNFTFIDLQPKANRSLDDKFTGAAKVLPKGEQSLQGVKFLVGERLIHLGKTILANPRGLVDLGDKVEGIRVEREFARLHILHATERGAVGKEGDSTFVADDTLIGDYRVHYEDGGEEIIPIFYGQDVRDWWDLDRSKGVTRGKVVWEGLVHARGPGGRKVDVKLRLYLTTWENPRPDRKVARIDYSRTMDTMAAPFCIAMTAEGE
jgi:WD40 repeat protein